MIFNTFQELMAHFNEDTKLEKYMRKYGSPEWNFTEAKHPELLKALRKNSFFRIDEDGISTSYPNQEFSEQQFVIRKKQRYNPRKSQHRHDYIEATYVLAGSYTQTINGEELVMGKGDFCLLDQNTVHSSSFLDENTIAVNLLFTPEFFDGIFLNLFTDSNHISNFIINSLYSKNKLKNYIIEHIEEDSFLNKILEKLLMEYFSDEIRSSAAIKGYLLILFTELSRLHAYDKASLKTASQEQPDLKKKILQYIEKNFRDINLNEMADYFHYHPAYLSSLIKKAFGKKLQDIIIEARLNFACQLLKSTNQSIEEIVANAGYKNKSHFYKLFQKHFELTPSQYRNQQVLESNVT
ncbi:AraC family transcriptional regulator [Neobacillus vireti]|uniref:AraC family transcriptional regulator n=1 Tax=Neobacillus vireti TaxID=220686 RepID=UPI002FFFB2B1